MKKNKKISFLLLIIVLLLGVGYALLTSQLSINGVSTINNATWNVYWNNVQIDTGSVTDVTIPARIKTGKTEVEFNVKLNTPGDYYEFTVDAVNAGTIDAMVGSFSKGVYASDGITAKELPDYLEYTVTYGDNNLIENKHLLAANSTATYKVRVSFKRDINASQLPSTDENLVFKFEVNYEQADETAEDISNSFCPGCVFLLGNIDEDFYYGENASVLTDDQYTDDYTETIDTEREECFIGMKLDKNNKVEKAYNCVYANHTPYCIEGITSESQIEQRINSLLSNNLFTLDHNSSAGYSFDFGEIMLVTVSANGTIESYLKESVDYDVGLCHVDNSYDDSFGPAGRFGHYSS